MTAFRTQAIAQYRRAHNLPREQAPDTFEDRDDFIATFYSVELFQTWLAEQGHTQRWTYDEVAEGIAYLMDLCLIRPAA
ncbi:MAG: hypothetical protein EOO40_11090 [Deltaproteobacteria bacterium]|nr:MAG: hypothetical protein EOO40_11090 [Deltaproteobacteria bacterium]